MSNVQQEICPFCGKVTRTDGKFCTECGHKIEGIFNSQTAYRAKINTKENERDEEVENLKATFNRIESYKGEYKEINSYGRKEEKKRIYIVVSLLAIFVIVFIVIEGDEVQCRAGCDWSISGISGKDEIKVAERLLAYLIEDPTAQDYLYMQGDLGDKTKLPVNKGAIETLIGDDAQFYKNILSEIDNFGYKGE